MTQSYEKESFRGNWKGGYTEAESVYNPYVTDGAGDGGDKALNLPPHPNQFPGGSDSKASAYSAGDPGLIPGLGRSPGEGNGNPLQYSCLENPRDGGAWWAAVYGVAQSRT